MATCIFNMGLLPFAKVFRPQKCKSSICIPSFNHFDDRIAELINASPKLHFRESDCLPN